MALGVEERTADLPEGISREARCPRAFSYLVSEWLCRNTQWLIYTMACRREGCGSLPAHNTNLCKVRPKLLLKLCDVFFFFLMVLCILGGTALEVLTVPSSKQVLQSLTASRCVPLCAAGRSGQAPWAAAAGEQCPCHPAATWISSGLRRLLLWVPRAWMKAF